MSSELSFFIIDDYLKRNSCLDEIIVGATGAPAGYERTQLRIDLLCGLAIKLIHHVETLQSAIENAGISVSDQSSIRTEVDHQASKLSNGMNPVDWKLS